jgi:hypothetical protein
MYGKPAMTFFKYQVFKNHHIFECYTLSGYRVSTMCHQTALTAHCWQAPSQCMVALLSPSWKRTSKVRLPYLVLKSKEKTHMVEEPLHVKQQNNNPYTTCMK